MIGVSAGMVVFSLPTFSRAGVGLSTCQFDEFDSLQTGILQGVVSTFSDFPARV